MKQLQSYAAIFLVISLLFGIGAPLGAFADFEIPGPPPPPAPPPPPEDECKTKNGLPCASSILFLPGLQGSRLYKGADRLWEPGFGGNADVEKLFLDDNGDPIDPSIYTRDVIDESFGFNIYKKFIEFLESLQQDEDIISTWADYPYDWRYDLEDIVRDGTHTNIGVQFVIDMVENLAEESFTGKVTIIGHSNGGLLAKTLVDELTDRGQGDLIDRVILVATPQLGTPKAVASILHGDRQDILKGFILNKQTARELAENMQSAYNLLPSAGYFDRIIDPVIEFDESVDRIGNFRTLYGNAIANLAELRQFLLGDNGARTEPNVDDTDSPNVLGQNFLDRAEENHSTLDAWQPPAGIEVVQIVGWGLDTIRGIEYFVDEDCTSSCILDRKPIFTIDGDRTVVTPSADVMDVETFYIDLDDHNSFFRSLRDRGHADIMEVGTVQTLIKKIIQGDAGELPQFTTIEKPIGDKSNLRISVHSPVEIHLYDSAGNHTGPIQNQNSNLSLIEETIPNSYYLPFGEGVYVGLDTEDEYTIELVGTDTGRFTLEIEEILNDEIVDTTTFKNVPVLSGSIAKLTTKTVSDTSALALDIEGDGTPDTMIEPSENVDPETALSVLKKIVYSLNLNNRIEKELIRQIERVEKILAHEPRRPRRERVQKLLEKIKTRVAERQLDHLVRIVERYAGGHIADGDAEMLINMIQQIKDSVVQ